jgi:hypothetical protein
VKEQARGAAWPQGGWRNCLFQEQQGTQGRGVRCGCLGLIVRLYSAVLAAGFEPVVGSCSHSRQYSTS